MHRQRDLIQVGGAGSSVITNLNTYITSTQLSMDDLLLSQSYQVYSIESKKKQPFN